MLSKLVVKNVALIHFAELDFGKGFTVLTGETGAGKSMLVDALTLALGARTDFSLITKGSDDAQIEATFEVSENSTVLPLLNNMGLSLDNGELVLRRVITSTNKSKAFANGMRVTQSQLKEMGEHLVDIHSQFDNQLLMQPRHHATFVDHFGKHSKILSTVSKTYDAYKIAETALQEALSKLANQEREEELLRSFLEELDAFNPQPDEDEQLADERRELMGNERLIEAFGAIRSILRKGDDMAGQLRSIEGYLSSVAAEGGEDIATMMDRASSLQVEVSDFVSEIDIIGRNFEPDPERLDHVEERLFKLRELARKHQCHPNILPEKHFEIQKNYDSLATLQEDMATLEKEKNRTFTDFKDACSQLTALRAKAAESLSKAVEKSVSSLNMKGTRFVVSLSPLPEDEWSATGAERVEFMVSTNAGQPVSSLIKVASGGEISRLMLALKQVVYAEMPAQTLIFDEVDTGVGGATADAIGVVLKTLSSKHQVFSITHQPQVAAKGHSHLKIEKKSSKEQTRTTVNHLHQDVRVDEIARMLSGAEITNAAREAALSLLNN